MEILKAVLFICAGLSVLQTIFITIDTVKEYRRQKELKEILDDAIENISFMDDTYVTYSANKTTTEYYYEEGEMNG